MQMLLARYPICDVLCVKHIRSLLLWENFGQYGDAYLV